MTRTRIGIHPLTKVESQGYSRERLDAQMEGYLPGERRTDPKTGLAYIAYPRDPNHARWQKKEAKKRNPRQTKTHSLDIEQLLEVEDAA